MTKLLISKHEVILVSSGAIGLGAHILGRKKSPKTELAEQQAFAAVGQAALINEYRQCFAPKGIQVGQALITGDDLAQRQQYLNLRNSLNKMLELNILPIINENDTTSVIEIEPTSDKGFGDNDVLAALVAAKLDADLLIILTSVNGLYPNGEFDPQDPPIAKISSLDELRKIQPGTLSQLGRGGAASKVEAARIASLCGISTIIANGLEPHIISNVMDANSNVGTEILPCGPKLSAKKKWIGFSQSGKGRVIVNEGAVKAIKEKHASLLPVGVTATNGKFKAGDVIQITDETDFEIARGVASYDSTQLNQVMGKKSSEFSESHPTLPEEVVHCDKLVLFQEKKYE